MTGPNAVAEENISAASWERAKRLIDRFDAFRDNPWPLLFRELHAYRPDSRFILTIRPTKGWVASVVGHFGEKSSPMRQWIYGVGSPLGAETDYAARYDRHNREVLEFFSDKPGSLLVMDLTAGDGWQELCAFLGGVDIPAEPFPHSNPGENHVRGAARRRIKRAKVLTVF